MIETVEVETLLLAPLLEKRRLGHLDEERVQHYMKVLPTCDPILVYVNGDERVVVNGYHRLEAATRLTRSHIRADLRPGTRIDAVRYLDLRDG